MLVLVLLLITFVAQLFGSASTQNTIVELLVLVVAVVALHLFIGLSGVYSFGHMAFAALGGYAAGLLSIPSTFKGVLLPQLPGWIASLDVSTPLGLLIGGAVATLFAAIVGPAVVKVSGATASIVTLAMLLIVRVVLGNADDFTGGYRSLTGIPLDLGVFGVLLAAAIVIVLAFALQRSRLGVRLVAAREDPAAARAAGIDVDRDRYLALLASAFVMGVAGGLYAHYLGAISPDTFYLQLAFLTIAMLVVGGVGTLSGAVLGAAAITIVTELLRKLEGGHDLLALHLDVPAGLAEVVLAALMLVVLIARPRGATGGRELRLARVRRRAPAIVSSTPDNPRPGR
ncbi:branched-chain amino acid ABC transporter permease [Conexibacter sp. CPCC 206217]|uniref:branched-chain amino acid ABC transporter permease n=1 Tax=Conexibacter sp. CPCC 206217 TaxID=3064574 RepID=UPI00271CAA3A|nr:branched-chain amino acid ABC transporter permease [Conexibacter sp. CPCC 206217]MDO8208807.1 branched-chain amino acid ABC transporter permease [Conexibacter sp. CPCC 206217]